MIGSPLFTNHERRVLAVDDRAIERVYGRRERSWRVTRAPVTGATCPHGVAVMRICDRCPVWSGA